MKMTCPTCQAVVPANRLNFDTDVAVCEQCNETFSISRLGLDGFDINDPPSGAWFEDFGDGWQIGATTRSRSAFFVIPFMCVWSGGSLGGIYGSRINGQINLFAFIFGIPFVLATLILGCCAVMYVCGKMTVTVNQNNDGFVFAGVGPIGWTRRFDWASIISVEEAPWPFDRKSPGTNGLTISLIGQSPLKFGSLLLGPRRYYLIQALRKLLASRVAVE